MNNTLRNFVNKISNDNKIFSYEDVVKMDNELGKYYQDALTYQYGEIGFPSDAVLRSSDDVVYVREYTRDDGTVVSAHYRSKSGRSNPNKPVKEEYQDYKSNLQKRIDEYFNDTDSSRMKGETNAPNESELVFPDEAIENDSQVDYGFDFPTESLYDFQVDYDFDILPEDLYDFQIDYGIDVPEDGLEDYRLAYGQDLSPDATTVDYQIDGLPEDGLSDYEFELPHAETEDSQSDYKFELPQVETDDSQSDYEFDIPQVSPNVSPAGYETDIPLLQGEVAKKYSLTKHQLDLLKDLIKENGYKEIKKAVETLASYQEALKKIAGNTINGTKHLFNKSMRIIGDIGQIAFSRSMNKRFKGAQSLLREIQSEEDALNTERVAQKSIVMELGDWGVGLAKGNGKELSAKYYQLSLDPEAYKKNDTENYYANVDTLKNNNLKQHILKINDKINPNTLLVCPYASSQLVQEVRNSLPVKSFIKNNINSIKNGKFKDRPSDIISFYGTRDLATVIGNGHIYDAYMDRYGNLNMLLLDYYDFNKRPHGKKFDYIIEVNNIAHRQQEKGELTNYMLMLRLKYTPKELERLLYK